MLFNYFSDAGHVIFFLKVFLSISLLIASVQHIVNRKYFGDGGILPWQIVKRRKQYKFFRAEKLDLVFNQNGFLFLNILRILLLVVFVFLPDELFILLGLNLVSYLIYFRSSLVCNASDQLNSVALAGLLISKAFSQFTPISAVIYFFAGVLMISYFTSGLLKLYEAKWMNGYYLKWVLVNRSFGRPSLEKFFSASGDRLYGIISKVTIFWQIGGILTPFMPPVMLTVYIAIALGFHLATGLFLGLNNFIWTFTGFLPALIFMNLNVLSAIGYY